MFEVYHDAIFAFIYFIYALFAIRVGYICWSQYTLAKMYNLKYLKVVYHSFLWLHVIFIIRGVLRIFAAPEYYTFANEHIVNFLTSYGHFVLHCLTYTFWCYFNLKLFKLAKNLYVN